MHYYFLFYVANNSSFNTYLFSFLWEASIVLKATGSAGFLWLAELSLVHWEMGQIPSSSESS